MHSQHSINMLTQNRASCSAGGLPRTPLLNDFWRSGALGHSNTDMGWLRGTARTGSCAVKESTLKAELRSPPKKRYVLLQADSAAANAALSGICTAGLMLKMLLPFHRYPKTRFAAMWTRSSCSAETLPRQWPPVCLHMVHNTASPPASPKPPRSSAAQLRGCRTHNTPLKRPQAQSLEHGQLLWCFSQHTDTALQLQQRLSCAPARPERGWKRVHHGVRLPGSYREAWGGRKAEEWSQKRESDGKPGSSCLLLLPPAWLE